MKKKGFNIFLYKLQWRQDKNRKNYAENSELYSHFLIFYEKNGIGLNTSFTCTRGWLDCRQQEVLKELGGGGRTLQESNREKKFID